MKSGSVVHRGSIAALRELAPEQAHRIITTTDDDRAAELAWARGLEVTMADDGLEIRGPQKDVDALVADIVHAGIALRGLTRDETPLEALFFMLTESAPARPPAGLDAATGARR